MERDSELQQFIDKNEDMLVEVSPGVSYSLRHVINESYRLLNAQFQRNPEESDGFLNVFTRKMWVVYRTLIQGADLDTKDAKVSSSTVAKQFILDLIKMIFHSHMKRTYFGEFIDDVKEKTGWFGSSITKRYNGTVGAIDLRNYITEAHIQDPQNRRHAELWFASFDEIQQYKKEWKNWDAVMEIWEKMQATGESQFKIIDFWTWNKEGKKVCKRSLDNTINMPGETTKSTDWSPYIKVDEFPTGYKVKCETKREKKMYGEYRDMFPYEQADLFKLPGRWLALGCGELLANPEMMYDQLYNTKRKMDLKALYGIIVHTSVPTQNGMSTLTQDNIAGLDKGTVISLTQGEKLEQLQMDTRGADFSAMEEKIYELMLQLVGITAQGTGQTVAASTSATQITDNRMVENKVYEHFKERMHHFLNRLMQHGYAQDMVEDISEMQFINIVGDLRQLREVDRVLVDNAMNKWMRDTKEATGMYPSPEEVYMVREQIETDLSSLGEMRFPEIKKEMINQMNYFIEWNFVDESVDYKQKMETLNAMRNDPNSTKSKSKIEDELISMAGLNPTQYEKTEEELQQEAMMQEAAMAKEAGLNSLLQPTA